MNNPPTQAPEDYITDEELIELEELEKEETLNKLRETLTNPSKHISPNYRLLHNAVTTQKWGYDKTGKPKLISGYAGAELQGSSRSTKTWGGIDLIIFLTTIKHKEKGCSINIYRATYNEFKTTLYDDFKRRLKDFDLDNKFDRATEISVFRIGKSTVNLLGDGKFGGGCDYAFFNEVMFISEEVFKQVTMRCRVFWWVDYNPCFSAHWLFERVSPREDVAFLRTTFKDNPFISPSELNEILITEPWLPGSYYIENDEPYYNGEPVSETNQPPPHPDNLHTADEVYWKVFGLGLKGFMKGAVIKQLEWIEEFPDMEFIYANDFGFTVDPNALVKYAEDEYNIWTELLIYHPIDSDKELVATLEALSIPKHAIIACDSTDKYTGENKGTVEMVKGLVKGGYRNAFKIFKNKGVMFWLGSFKQKKLHVVKNHLWRKIKLEKQNYVFKEINGIQINQPIDKHNHFFDSTRYGHMAHNTPRKKALGSREA